MKQILQKYECMSVFEEYITNKYSRTHYLGSFDRFLRHFGLTDPSYLLTLSNEETYNILKKYIMHFRDRVEKGTLKVNSIRIELAGIIHFYTYNDKIVNWKKLFKMIPQTVKKGGAKAYTKDQIRAMLNVTNKVRNKLLVLFMISTGARVGSLKDIKLKHVTPIENCYSVTLYTEEKEQYHVFMTPECSRMYEQYLQTRKNDGEVVTQESPLFRHDYSEGKSANAHLRDNAVARIIERMVENSGIERVKTGRRYDIALDHGLRKLYATCLKSNAQISQSVTERLLGHQAYLENSYFLPQLEELFEQFKKAIYSLTIDTVEIQKEEIRNLKANKAEFDKLMEENESQSDKVSRLEQILNNALKKIDDLETKQKEN